MTDALDDVINIVTEIGKTDAIKKYIEQSFLHGSELSLFVDFGLTTVGIINSIIQGRNLKKNSLLIKNELEKVTAAIAEIDKKMKKHNISVLSNFLNANLNDKMYQFVRTIFQEAIDAKSDKLREYCASTIVYAGEADYANGIDYRKLYRCLKIIQELDDLDVDIIKYYDLNVLKAQKNTAFQNKRIFTIHDEIINDGGISAQDIFLSCQKLNRVGLLDYGINNTKSEEYDMKKQFLIDLIALNNPNNPTPVYNEFNQYVHTFI